ncbi:hypothetical protein BV96_01057 [Sphingomonas paucimobilis]|nr:hypothetical protein BV96_01057 [Sphingomonas paucimobilis]
MSYYRAPSRTAPPRSSGPKQSRNANYPEPYTEPPVSEEIPMPGGIVRVDYR